MLTETRVLMRPWSTRLAPMAALSLSLSVLLPAPAAAQAASAAACKLKDRSERVAVVVCAPGTAQPALKAAGADACKGQSMGCNAWIWDDAAKAPAKAPAIDTDMPKATTGSARAVWLQDSESLMELRKAR